MSDLGLGFRESRFEAEKGQAGSFGLIRSCGKALLFLMLPRYMLPMCEGCLH